MAVVNRVVKNTGYLYAKMCITVFISLYSTRLILQALGVSDFGIFNIVGGAIAMLGFLNNSMATATQRFMNFYEGEGNVEKLKEVFNVGIILHFLIAVVLGFSLVILGHFLFNGILNIPPDRMFAAKVVYGSLILSTIFTVMTVPYDAMLNAHENMRYYAIVGVMESVLKLLVAIAITNLAGDKLILYGILMAIIPFISLTIMRVYCHRHYEECVFGFRKYWNRQLLKEETSYAGCSFLTSCSMVVTNYGIGIILNSFYGVVVNAAQGVASQVSGYAMTFSSSAMKALNPVIVKSEGAGDRDRLIYTALLGCRMAFAILALFAIPLILETPLVLKIWLGTIPDWTIIFCRLQLMYIMLEQLLNGVATSVYAEGNIKKYTLWKSVMNLSPLFLIPLLLSLGYPPYIVYIVQIFSWIILGGGVLLYFARVRVNLSHAKYIKEVLLPVLFVTVGSVFAYFLFLGIRNDTLWSVFMVLAAETIVYLLLTWNLLLQQSERLSICNLLKNIKHRL